MFFNIPRNRRLRYIVIILVWLSVRLSAQVNFTLAITFEPKEIRALILHMCILLVPNIFPRDLYLDF